MRVYWMAARMRGLRIVLLLVSFAVLPLSSTVAISVVRAPQNVVAIQTTPRGIWVASYGGGLWRETADGWKKLYAEHYQYLTSLAVGPKGKLYAGTWMGRGLLSVDLETENVRTVQWPWQMPAFSRDMTLTQRLAFNGRDLVVSTLAGLAKLDADERWTKMGNIDDIPTSALLADENGVWCSTTRYLVHLNRGGEPDRSVAIGGRPERSWVTSIATDGPRLLLGTSAGLLVQYHPDTEVCAVLAEAPKGVHASLLQILPKPAVVYLAYGEPSMTVNDEPDRGGLGIYDRLTQKVIMLEGLPASNWKCMAIEGDALWAAGKIGLIRVPLLMFETLRQKGQAVPGK